MGAPRDRVDGAVLPGLVLGRRERRAPASVPRGRRRRGGACHAGRLGIDVVARPAGRRARAMDGDALRRRRSGAPVPRPPRHVDVGTLARRRLGRRRVLRRRRYLAVVRHGSNPCARSTTARSAGRRGTGLATGTRRTVRRRLAGRDLAHETSTIENPAVRVLDAHTGDPVAGVADEGMAVVAAGWSPVPVTTASCSIARSETSPALDVGARTGVLDEIEVAAPGALTLAGWYPEATPCCCTSTTRRRTASCASTSRPAPSRRSSIAEARSATRGSDPTVQVWVRHERLVARRMACRVEWRRS